MAKKTTHTHTGTCQACGAKQAVDNNTRLMAKHGYKVAGFGFFNGTCPGSDQKPAELDITYTHHIITVMGEMAAENDRLQALYASHELMVVCRSVRSGKRDAYSRPIYIDVPMFGCPDYVVDDQQKHEAYSHESAAKMQRSHAESLVRYVIPRFMKPLFKAKAKAPVRHFEIGQVVTVNGRQFKLVAARGSTFGSGRVTGYRVARIEGGIEADTRGHMSLVQLRKSAQ